MDHQYTLCDDANNIEYNPDQDELLIELVKAHPYLYDKKHVSFKDINLKNNSWAEIATASNMPVEYCMNRWSRLRERFAKLSKFNAKVENAPKKIFPAYESLQFLSPHIKRRKRFMISSSSKSISPKPVVQVTKQQPVTYYVNCGIPTSTVSTPTVFTQGTKLVIPGNPAATYLLSNMTKKQDNNFSSVAPKIEESDLLLNNNSDEDSNQVTAPEVSFEEDTDCFSKDHFTKAKKQKMDSTDYFSLFVGEELKKLPENVRKEKKKRIFAILME